jgi:UDP-glucose 4-epimerase
MTNQKPSCIVLGGSGFIGMNLCRRLYSAGFRVRAFGRRRLFPDELLGTEWYEGDFGDASVLAKAIESFDIVFHLIHGTTPQSANLDMVADVEKNVVSSLSLLEICRKLGVARVVFVSSGGTIYGPAQYVPTPETAPTDPLTAYGVSKLSIEKYLALYEHLHRLDYRVLRVTNPFGPYQVPVNNQGVIAALVSRALQKQAIEIWGDGSVVRDFIFIDDVVDALVAVAGDQSSFRIFNIGSGQGRSLREAIAAVELRLDTQLTISWKPARVLDVPVSIAAIDRAREVLRWAPKTSFDTGLEKTIGWWRGGGMNA